MPVATPVCYDPSLEQRADDEEQTAAALRETLHTILETTAKDYGHAVRSVHAKGHGLVDGVFEVLDGLPTDLAQGLFARPERYDAVLRFSTNAGDILDDSVVLPRGAALKIVDADGAGRSQDFVMVDGPAFASATPKAFLPNLKLLAKTTDRGEGAKKILSGVLRATESVLEAVGLESATLQTLGGARSRHPLGETYYSQTPFLYGPYVAKFSLKPVSANLVSLAHEKVSVAGRPDALREDIAETIIEGDSVWEFCVQLCTDSRTMPIEDASVAWDEEASPFVPVARLTVPAQTSWAHGVTDRREDALLFTPWHCLADHRPLGGVNRARQGTYEMSAEYRGQFNGCPIHEPRSAAG